jgi:hypothetical protein
MGVLAGQKIVPSMFPALVASAAAVTSTAAIGTTETVVLSVSATYVSGKAYRIRVRGGLNADAVNREAIFAVRKTNAAGTMWADLGITASNPVSGTHNENLVAECYIVNSTGADITATTCLTLHSVTGTVTMTGGAAGPRYMTIELVGDASDYSSFGFAIS